MEPRTSVSTYDPNYAKEETLNENPLFKSAALAIKAGIVATVAKYKEVDDDSARKNPVRGTIPYDNSKSVFYQ